jgi:hypothetical protein
MKRVLLEVTADHGVRLPPRAAHARTFTPTTRHLLPAEGCMLGRLIWIRWQWGQSRGAAGARSVLSTDHASL